mmetsp:Transcript_113099/g.325120  ORF Transcript_113099/g.325120 Transcript_113099/m.325120 type:complete len:651 (-) Transcript_113099:116-2068(-)
MQALRNLLGGGDASFQTFADQLRDFPQQLWRRTGHGGDGMHHRATVSGEHKFHFSLQFEPRSEGGDLCQTGVLVAKAFTGPDARTPLAINCRWKRRIGSHLIEIPNITHWMYHASADDIGMEIICQASCPDEPGMGQAFGVLGPFELDPITRMSLENNLASGGSPFPARHCRDQDDAHPRDLQIRVTQDFVKVVHPGPSHVGNKEVSAPYTADYPKVVLHPADTCKFTLILNEEPDKTYRFQALSRTSRDLIALLIRCFHARRYVATTFILSRLFQNPATPGAPMTSVQAGDFDIQSLAERLGKELNRTIGQLEVVERVVRNANLEKSELQAQLRETIASYTEAIEQLHAQLANARGGPAAMLRVQLHEARNLHTNLQLEIQEVRQQLAEEQQLEAAGGGGAMRGGGGQSSAEVEELRNETQQLRLRISASEGDQQDQNKRDLTRAEELRRLRADVDMLNSEKEALESNNLQADKEKAELIDNFVYVKGCLDKLQMASLETPAASPDHERQVSQLKATYSQVAEERNRLAARVEEQENERYKQKQQRESALERLMNANAHVLEERDKYVKEKARISALYQNTMGAMGAAQPAGGAVGTLAAAGAEGDDGRCDQATLEAMRKELAEKTHLLQEREREGESLRQRLRKLAMV